MIASPSHLPKRMRSLQTWLPWALLAGMTLPIFWPFYREGLPRSFDGGLHLLRLGLLDNAIREGAFYPRWSSDALLGFGYPLFSYYAPGSYYLAELLHLFGLGFYGAFVAAFVLLIAGGGAGIARLAWDLFGGRPWPAALAALVYVYSPYLVTNTYIRGALAEVAAQALLPWILWSARRVICGPAPARAILPLSFSLAALAITHNITLLFTPPLLLGYMATLWFATGRPRSALLRTAAALLLAMGLSAFFWLPLLLERAYVANTGFDIARTVWLPASAWTRANFLDGGWTYTHTFARPIRLGLLQLVLALLGAAAGAIALRQRTAEWLFWCAVALISGVLMSAWALPLWQSSDLLTLAQFTWRLLSIQSLALALLAGGLVAWTPRRPLVLAASALLLMGLVVYAERPRLAWMDVFAPESVDVSLQVLAQTEIEKGILGGGEGNSSIQEFRPRWAPMTLAAESLPPVTPPRRIELDRAGRLALSARITSDRPGPLRLATFYFPGWQVMLDGAPLTPYPSGDLGLLTVDLPAGEHTVEIRWQGTPLQRLAGWLSTAALAAGLALAVVHRRPGFALVAGVSLAVAVVAYSVPPQTPPVAAPAAPSPFAGLHLVGYRIEQRADQLDLYPYWLVQERLSPDMKLAWTLQDTDGASLAELITRPYHNAIPADIWSAGTFVDDSYRLALPPGLPAGSYRLTLGNPATGATAVIGIVDLVAVPLSSHDPQTPLDIRMGESARLTGYHLEYPARTHAAATPLPVVRPGDYLRVHLTWQADQPLDQNLHGFVHVVDSYGWPLVQEDQLPGPFFQPPTLWTNTQPAPDVYLLRVPDDALGGVYTPQVGLYNFATLERLPVTVPPSTAAADTYALPPLKVIGAEPPKPDIQVGHRLGDLATLVGATLDPTGDTLAPGSVLKVTLHYRVLQPTPQNWTRFVQLLDTANQVIAQSDSLPQDGRNPTWAWVQGEMVTDHAGLLIPPGIPPGRYRLVAGLYDAAAGSRLPVIAPDGKPVPEQWAEIAEVQIVTAPPNQE